MAKSIVYLATNTVNGKRYIGVTCKLLCQRKAQHYNEAIKGKSHCRLFHRAIRKYGPENFYWEVISRHDDYSSALAEEIRLIALEKPEYNLTAGGEGTKGLRLSPEATARMAATLRGRKLSDEHRRKISEGMKGCARSADVGKNISRAKKGKTFTAEHREALSKAHIGKAMSEAQRAAFKTSWVKGMKMDPTIVAKREAARKRNREQANVV